MELESNLNCQVCDSSVHSHFLSAVDDYTGRPGKFSYVKCGDCGLIYQNPRLSLAEVSGFYDDNYLSHQRRLDFGVLTPFVNWALTGHDRRKAKLVNQHKALGPRSRVLDVGCARATFLKQVRAQFGSQVSGVDFKDMRRVTDMEEVDFRLGLFYEQDFASESFDAVTMWHFLEHCYDPARSLTAARDCLKKDGVLVIEVPNVDSLSFRIFGRHWPGVQAPQHTVLFDPKSLRALLEKQGFRILTAHNWGTFPPFFYFFLGSAFKFNRGRGFDVRKHLLAYFLIQTLTWPFFLLFGRRNLAMQVMVCQKAG